MAVVDSLRVRLVSCSAGQVLPAEGIHGVDAALEGGSEVGDVVKPLEEVRDVSEPNAESENGEKHSENRTQENGYLKRKCEIEQFQNQN